MDTSTAVVILGMHRSGTSALAGMLGNSGIQFGRSLLPGQSDNPRGFWEHTEIVDLNERILASFGSSWDDMQPPQPTWWEDEKAALFREEISRILTGVFGKTQLWGIKDPRLCKLVPLWRRGLDDVGCKSCFILIHRHPLEVARSLKRRNGFHTMKSGLLWLQHNLLAEKWTRGSSRLFTSYDEILRWPDGTSVKIAEMLGTSSVPPSPRQMEKVRDFLTTDLRHHETPDGDWGAAFGEYRSLVEGVYNLLVAESRSPVAGTGDALDRLFEEYQSITSKFDPVLVAHIEDLATRNGRLQDDIRRVKSSKAWKIARALRVAKALNGTIAKGAIRQ